MKDTIEISKKKARSILSCLSILTESPCHGGFLRRDARKDFNYLDSKLYPKKRQ